MKRITLGISAAVLVLAGAGFAAEEHGFGMQSETRAQAQMHAERLFDRLDLNHDGKLDQADHAAEVSAMFDRLDTNHDGVLSRAEFAAAHDHMMDEDHHGGGMGGHGMDGHGMGGDHGGHEHHEGGMMMARMIMERADPAHSGTVTRAAFVQAALALFEEADSNHDGVLSPAERQAAHQAMHAGRPEHDGMAPGMGSAMPPPAR